jgi:hypothetical protein
MEVGLGPNEGCRSKGEKKESISYEAPHYAVFSNLLSLHLTLVQIFSSTSCSQTPSVYIPHLMSDKKNHTHTGPKAKL